LIIEIYPLFGEYDIICKVEAVGYDTLAKVVIRQIRSINGVIDTKTLTGLKF